MTTALVEDLSEPRVASECESLADLAALDVEELTAQIERALPSAGSRQVSVAAFQSSI
ncbi:FxSxx-COOH cyclophane-containing RiPP peptide [Kitasatospora phosalacinea]|uniref:FxSxx-COOH cyclophane-containing RiPP peptide n=1 Tax=Kitasatospora phosalacinea TaxID=2065 RepID=UPI0035E00C07